MQKDEIVSGTILSFGNTAINALEGMESFAIRHTLRKQRGPPSSASTPIGSVRMLEEAIIIY
ncbi:hypothetical protein KDAU_74200 [Dictyobacter aurantiacus]|uniref:Uncharacterized protein n=1 Tax=Dictyobacter aurantiacus TaxID=1936993 RepID=A0A401ZT99_9CHLR|nr:hypothetical protein KDAU_74200 [Dictyobacter aurantiacus]